jgi:hypothetical protein
MMKKHPSNVFPRSICKVAVAMVAMMMAASPAVIAKPNPKKASGKVSDKIILVRPADLPELARQTGEAMLLHDTGDGRKILYVEQNHGARLAIFDVTDPAHIKGETAVRLEVPGSFDFVSALGDHAELLRFRLGQGAAVLDLRKEKVPSIKRLEWLEVQALRERLGDDGFIVTNHPDPQPGSNIRDCQIVDISNPLDPKHVADLKHVLQEITNGDTGTTFLLTADGLYLVRRPAVEEDYRIHQYQLSHPG